MADIYTDGPFSPWRSMMTEPSKDVPMPFWKRPSAPANASFNVGGDEYSTPSPWGNLNYLLQDINNPKAEAPSAGFSEYPQESMNAQNVVANEMQQPQSIGASAVKAGPDLSGIDKLMKEFELAKLAGTKDQQESIAQMKRFRDAMPLGQVGADLSPLLALSDSWSPGGKLLQGYKAPETSMDKIGRATGLSEKIGAAAGKLSDDQMALLKDKLNAEMYKLQYGSQKADKEKEKKDREIEQDAQKLEKRIEDGMTGIKYNLDSLDSVLGGLQKDDSGKIVNIPGVGPGQNLRPSFTLDSNGQQIRQLTLALVADAIKAQSGVTVNEQEAERKMKEFGLAWDSTPDQFISGLKNTRAKTIAAIKKKEAAFRPEVLDVYRSRGGISSKDLEASSQPKQEKPSIDRKIGTTGTTKDGKKVIWTEKGWKEI